MNTVPFLLAYSSFDPFSLIGLVVGVVVVGAIVRQIKGGPLAQARAALVMSSFEIHRDGPVYVRIQGRKSGLMSWLLAQVGVDPSTTLTITKHRVELSEGSLSGRVFHQIPLSAVCNLGAGYSKPIALFALGIVFAVMGLGCLFSGGDAVALGFVFLLAAAALVVVYYLQKTLTLFFLPPSGTGACLSFKRSVIEGVSVDEREAYEVVELVTSLIELNTKPVAGAQSAPRDCVCPKCGQALEMPPGIVGGQRLKCAFCGEKFTV